ncbi:MAG: cysteine desulfurase NifS [Simkaniaceae bacterium]
MKRIYLDNNATTFLAPEIAEILKKEISTSFGNPSSLHHFGQKAKNQILKSKDLIASFFKISPMEIIFTSGGTEGINFLLQNAPYQNEKNQILTSKSEHKSTLHCMKKLEEKGFEIVYLKPTDWGAPTSEQIAEKINNKTCLIFLSLANNETGVVIDLENIARLAEKHNIPLFIDAVSALGRYSFAIPSGVTGMVFSGHKIHAPAGIGFVYLKKGHPAAPLMLGGGQEMGRRGGTENLLGIIGLGKAMEYLKENLEEYLSKQKYLRDLLEQLILSNLSKVCINGKGPRNANTSNLYFEDIDGEIFLMHLDRLGIAASMGSACSSGGLEPSHVLKSMGFDRHRVNSSVRFSLSRLNTEDEIRCAAQIICRTAHKLRNCLVT